MKKSLSVCVVLLLIFSMMAVSFSETTTEEVKLTGDYSSDFDLVLNRITELGDNADIVASINTLVWQAAGPETAMSALAKLLEIGEKGTTDDVSWYTLYRDDYREAFGSYDEYTHVTYAKKYYEAYTSVSSEVEVVKNYVKELKNTYPDRSGAIDALKAYYIKASAYADFAINPSGNLMSLLILHAVQNNSFASSESFMQGIL